MDRIYIFSFYNSRGNKIQNCRSNQNSMKTESCSAALLFSDLVKALWVSYVPLFFSNCIKSIVSLQTTALELWKSTARNKSWENLSWQMISHICQPLLLTRILGLPLTDLILNFLDYPCFIKTYFLLRILGELVILDVILFFWKKKKVLYLSLNLLA